MKKYALLASIIFFFVGCSPQVSIVEHTVIVKETVHVPQTVIVPVTVIVTPTDTPEPSQTPTIAKTPTTEPTATIGLTKDDYLELYDTNGGCKLPCWWGVTPGKTTEDDLKVLFAPYADFVHYDDVDKILYYEPANDSVDYTIATRFYFENGKVSSMWLDLEASMWGGFSPTYLLKNHGTPDEVFISPTRLVMLYEKPGIIAEYLLCESNNAGNYCFCAFNPLDLGVSFENWSLSGDAEIKPWAEATNKSIQVFYDAFKTFRGTESCFSIK
jgi:hypothetical protein